MCHVCHVVVCTVVRVCHVCVLRGEGFCDVCVSVCQCCTVRVCVGCVLCVLGACGCVFRQLHYNCITQPGLFSQKDNERQGSRTKSVKPSHLETSRDASSTRSLFYCLFFDLLCLSLLQCLLSRHTPETQSHTDTTQRTTSHT